MHFENSLGVLVSRSRPSGFNYFSFAGRLSKRSIIKTKSLDNLTLARCNGKDGLAPSWQA